MSWKEIKKVREDRIQLQHDMRSVLDKAEAEKRDLTADENGKFDELHKRDGELRNKEEKLVKLADIQIDDSAVAEAEARSQKPGREDVEVRKAQTETTKEDADAKYAKAFRSYLRNGDSESRAALATADMGVVGNRPFLNQIVESLTDWTGVLAAGATVLNTADGGELNMPTANDTANTGKLLAESVEETGTTKPTMSVLSLSGYKYSSEIILLPIEMAQDSTFDIEGYIVRAASERIGKILNTHTTTGSGTARPKGFTVAASNGKVAASTSAITYEELLDLVHSVNAAYRRSPGFAIQMNDTTLAAVRKLKDTAGSYVFQPGIADQPDVVLGKKLVVNNDMAELGDGASSKVVAAGDFSRYYVRNAGATVVQRLVERYAEFGQVGFIVLSRHDGDLADTSAVKLLALAAS